MCTHYFFESAGLTVDEAFGQYVEPWDITGVSEKTFMFPFRSTSEWKKVNNGSYPSARDFTCGQFSLRVRNPPAQIDGVSNVIQINAYCCGAPDYQLRFLGNNAIDFYPLPIAQPLVGRVVTAPARNRRPRRGRRVAAPSTRPQHVNKATVVVLHPSK